MVYIENPFMKYAGVPAVILRNENMLLTKLLNKCHDEEPFLFGCDSCEVVTTYHSKCLAEAKPEDAHKHILITAFFFFELYDANAQFKGKFVFYSPQITHGVEFNVDIAQDVFIYIRGNSIQTTGSFQQATRCRNKKQHYVVWRNR